MKSLYYKSVYGISCVKLLQLKLQGLVLEVKKIKNKLKNSNLKNIEYINDYNCVVKTTNKQIYQNQLYLLRREIRSYHLAIAFLKNINYKTIEVKTNSCADISNVNKILLQISYYTSLENSFINKELMSWFGIIK